jgi:ribonuclease H / adenosylcobalamin/alpha-ribazole phosphatase
VRGVRPDPRPHAEFGRVSPSSAATAGPSRVVVEADGGSRGNPGPAGYGALLRNAETGEVVADVAESIGRATNNVAEYRGLIAGLRLYAQCAPGASLEVRMDSKLVIEQMAGRWKVKHPDMRPLALEARSLAPAEVTWTWVPREQNTAADRLANLAMDAAACGETYVSESRSEVPEPPVPGVAGDPALTNPMLGWSGDLGTETRLILMRHGETDNTVARLFCGPGGADPGLNSTGREQVRRTAVKLVRDVTVDAVLTSPMRRARETAELITSVLRVPIEVVEGFAECRFGEWDGLTLQQVRERWPTELDAWLASHDARPTGGESIVEVQSRVEEALRQALTTYSGKTVVMVSHVNPIKLVVRRCLDAPLHSIHRMLVAPGSTTSMSFYESGACALLSFSAEP